MPGFFHAIAPRPQSWLHHTAKSLRRRISLPIRYGWSFPVVTRYGGWPQGQRKQQQFRLDRLRCEQKKAHPQFSHEVPGRDTMGITIGSKTFKATFEDNPPVAKLKSLMPLRDHDGTERQREVLPHVDSASHGRQQFWHNSEWQSHALREQQSGAFRSDPFSLMLLPRGRKGN